MPVFKQEKADFFSPRFEFTNFKILNYLCLESDMPVPIGTLNYQVKTEP